MLHVTDDFMQVLACLFSQAWRICISFNIPGTNINVVELAFACLMIVFVLRWVGPLLGLKDAGQAPDGGNDVAAHNAKLLSENGMYNGYVPKGGRRR